MSSSGMSGRPDLQNGMSPANDPLTGLVAGQGEHRRLRRLRAGLRCERRRRSPKKEGPAGSVARPGSRRHRHARSDPDRGTAGSRSRRSLDVPPGPVPPPGVRKCRRSRSSTSRGGCSGWRRTPECRVACEKWRASESLPRIGSGSGGADHVSVTLLETRDPGQVDPGVHADDDGHARGWQRRIAFG